MAIIIQNIFALGRKVSLTELRDKGILAEFHGDSLKIKNVYCENCIIIRGSTKLTEEVERGVWKRLYPNDVLFWGEMGKFGIFVISAEAEANEGQENIAAPTTNDNNHHNSQKGHRSNKDKGFRRSHFVPEKSSR